MPLLRQNTLSVQLSLLPQTSLYHHNINSGVMNHSSTTTDRPILPNLFVGPALLVFIKSYCDSNLYRTVSRVKGCLRLHAIIHLKMQITVVTKSKTLRIQMQDVSLGRLCT